MSSILEIAKKLNKEFSDSTALPGNIAISDEVNSLDKQYIIYQHLNRLNNKCYIGQTCQFKVMYRWGYNGNHYNKQPKFFRAIQKYGWDNFEHIILKDKIYDKEQANYWEIYFIYKYDSIKNGYNVDLGGNNYIGTMSCKSIVMLDTKGSILNYFKSITDASIYIKNLQNRDSTIKRISTNISNVCHRKLKYAYGFGWCFLDDLPNYKSPQRISNKRPVIQKSLNGEFIKEYPSIMDACRHTGIKNITKCCNKKRKKAGNYIWEFK